MKGINWREYPMVRLLLPMALGIVVADQWPSSAKWQIEPVLTGCFFLAGIAHLLRPAHSRRWYFGLVLAFLLVMLGWQRTLSDDASRKEDYFAATRDRGEVLIARVEEADSLKWGSRATMQAVGWVVPDGGGSLRPASGRFLAYFRDAEPRPFDLLTLRGEIEVIGEARNPAAFDYARYLELQGIHHRMQVQEYCHVGRAKSPIMRMLSVMRGRALGALRRVLPEPADFGVAAALLLGHRDDLPDEIGDAYAETGAIHVLAVSGLHVGYVYFLLTGLTGRWGIRRTYAGLLFVLTGIGCYAVLTGLSPSVMRASTMFGFLALGNCLRRSTNVYNSLAASAFALLWIQPKLLFQPGFQLSYLAVLGIVYFQPRLYKLVFFPNRPTDHVWKLLCVSLAAQVTTLPLLLHYFHQFPLYFWLSSLIVVPAAGLIIPLGFSFLITLLLPPVNDLIAWTLESTISGMNGIILKIRQFPAALIEHIWVDLPSLLILYAMLTAIVLMLRSKNFFYIKATLMLGIGLAAYLAILKWDWCRQKQIAFYFLPGHSAVDFLNGRRVAGLVSEGVDPRSLAYARDNYRLSRGTKREEEDASFNEDVQITGLQQRRMIYQFLDFRMIVIDGRNPRLPAGDIKVDLILVRESPETSLTDMKKVLDFDRVIFDGSSDYRRLPVWKAECRALGIECRDLRETGGFVVDLRRKTRIQ